MLIEQGTPEASTLANNIVSNLDCVLGGSADRRKVKEHRQAEAIMLISTVLRSGIDEVLRLCEVAFIRSHHRQVGISPDEWIERRVVGRTNCFGAIAFRIRKPAKAPRTACRPGEQDR